MLELVWPLMKLKELDGPTYWNWRPAMLGMPGASCGWTPSNFSERVACSPSVSVSRSSDAVNDAANDALVSSALARSTNQIFGMNRMASIRHFRQTKAGNVHKFLAGRKRKMKAIAGMQGASHPPSQLQSFLKTRPRLFADIFVDRLVVHPDNHLREVAPEMARRGVFAQFFGKGFRRSGAGEHFFGAEMFAESVHAGPFNLSSVRGCSGTGILPVCF